MHVFTYFTPLADVPLVDESKLILLWRQRWKAANFVPMVLNEWWARRHPLFAEYDKAVSALPSINPGQYDRACFLRWMAVCVALSDLNLTGAVMSDYDVMPYTTAYNINKFIETDRLTILQQHVPSLVAGTSEHFEDQCLRFASYTLEPEDTDAKGQTHMSDMIILAKQKSRDPKAAAMLDVVKSYGEKDWEVAPFVHYANAAMLPVGHSPRWKYIEVLRQ